MTNISFDNPYFLLIAIPLVALVLVPFFIAFRKQNRDKHVIASLVLHFLMIVCVALAAAGFNVTRVVTEMNVYVVADVSYSSNLNLDEMDVCISKVQSKLPKNSRMGVVCFGKDALVHNAMGDSITKLSETELTVDNSATDILGALEYTAGLFADDVIKHIVLITDANQTGGVDGGDLRQTLAVLKQKDIYVDAIYLDATLPTDVDEVQLNGVEYVQSTYLGEGAQATAVIQSNTEKTAFVTLQKGEEIVATDTIDLIVGENDFAFTLDTSAAGSFDYTLTVSQEKDSFTLNNAYAFTQTVKDKQNILFVTSMSSDKAMAQKLYGGEDTELDVYEYTPALSQSGKKLKVPTKIEDLCKYDQIILSNINVPEQVDNYTQFVNNLNVAVSTYGKSLLTFGDLHLQNKTDAVQDLENLENMLPVQFGVREQDATLYGIVMDISRSMNSNSKLQTAKDAATFLIDQFTPKDGIIVVSYSAAGVTVMSMRNANETGKQLARDAINAITPIQGTYVAGGLERMRLEMSSISDFLNKQVIVIGDSKQPGSGSAGLNPVNVAAQMSAEGIRVSTLNIDSEEDEGNFSGIATAGKGNYYKGFTESQLKSVLEGAIADDLMGTVVEGVPTYVDIQLPTDDVLDGVGAFNPITGYICGKSKGDSIVVMTVDYERASGTSTKVPLYSYRDCGEGRVATFNSSLSGTWVTEFLDENGERAGMQFFRNILDTSTPTQCNDYPCLYTVTPGAKTEIEVIPSNLRQMTTVELILTTPSGDVQTHTLTFDVSRHFGAIETAEIGKYLLTIKYTDNGTTYETTTSFMIPYLEEYNRFAGYSAGLLYELIDERGVVSLTGDEISFKANEDEIETYVYSLVIPLLIACVALFIVDVCVRKLRWNDIKSLFVRTNKRSKKGGKQ
ncbi:MAG: VWA domain-containing protein [Clostridia bacterium]|nr:VWA domain-containing protein [Clostridia bacterium]